MYPRFVYTQIERNNQTTAKFFNGKYKNTKNLDGMKAALLRQGRMSDEDINMKIVPELVLIADTEQFYTNHLIKAGLRDKDTTK